MKKITSYGLMILLATSTLFLNSCSKERIETEEEEERLTSYSSMNDYYNSKKQEEQEFIITDTGSGPIIGKEGSKIWIGKSILQFPNGDTVGWPFTLSLVELYTVKEMIYYQIPTVAGGTIMKTEGEIRVRAFKDGTELVLKPNAVMKVELINSSSSSDLETFYGVDKSTFTDWTNTPSTVFSNSSYGYESNISILGWVNCGELAGASTNYKLNFISSTDLLDNLSIFVYFPSTKGLMQVYNKVSGSIPENSNIEIIVMGIDAGGQLFSYSETINGLTADRTISVTMSSISDSALETKLDNL